MRVSDVYKRQGYYNVSRNSSQIRTVDNVYVSQYLTADLNFVVRQRIVLESFS